MTGKLDLLRLEATDQENTFRASYLPDTHGVVAGGQLLALMIAAAAQTLPGKQVKSLHAIFNRGASPTEPLELQLTVLSGTRSFGSIAATVLQAGRICSSGLALLHVPDENVIRHGNSPVGRSFESATERTCVDDWEIRTYSDQEIKDPDAVGPAELDVWSRFSGGPYDVATSQALLAYASGGFLIGTAMRPHPGFGQAVAHRTVSTSVMSHTLVFHETFDASEWHLLAHRSPYAGRGRSFGTAHVWTTDGHLVASYSQENMIRSYPEGRKPKEGQASKF